MGYQARLARRAKRRGWSEQKLIDKINNRTTVRQRTKNVFKSIGKVAGAVAVDLVPASGFIGKVPGVAAVVGKVPGADVALQNAIEGAALPKSFESFLTRFLRDLLPWQTIIKWWTFISDVCEDFIDFLEDYDVTD